MNHNQTIKILTTEGISDDDKLRTVLRPYYIDNAILQQFVDWCAANSYGALSDKFARGQANKEEIWDAKTKSLNGPATYAATKARNEFGQKEQVKKLLELLNGT